MYNYRVEASEEVLNAIAEGLPVVALESTIISHGMPYPKNLETALEAERIIRENKAIPATIGVIGGVPKAGLSLSEMELLAKKGLDVVKVSRRDLPVIMAERQDGATTVAATMIIAHKLGIKVFATGGIGGVHRGAEKTMDISADLEELAHTDVTVVCAGAKSILDIGLTLEYLETKGVPVLGYQTDEMPAFYTQQSGFKVNYRVETPKEIAEIIHARDALRFKNGMIVANPIPDEYSMESHYINHAIEVAVKEAAASGITGKKVTPFLLDRIQRITQGKSLEANVRLVYSNAELAARIAYEI